MMFKIHGEIEKKCNEYLKQWEKWNNEDPEPYRRRGDMNRYVITLNKRHWTIPFVLGQYDQAKEALATQIRCVDESDQLRRDKGQWDASEERLKFSLSWVTPHLTYEDLHETEERVHGFDERFPEWFLSGGSLSHNLSRLATLGLLGKTDLIAELFKVYRGHYVKVAREQGVDESVVDLIMKLILAEHQFWSGDIEGLDESAATLMQTVKKIPKRCYLQPNDLSLLWFERDYYIAFAWFCQFLLLHPKPPGKLERSAAMMVLCSLEGHIISADILAVKYYEIIAQMLAGKKEELASFYEHFPILSKLIENFADNLLSKLQAHQAAVR